jgi:hypothetical protein
MKRLTVNNFSNLAGERILVNGVPWMILSAIEDIGDEDYLGVLQFVGREGMVLIENEIRTSPGGNSYVRFVYSEDGVDMWKSQLLLSELRDMNTTLRTIGNRLTEMVSA